jgi:tRNA uridine 5-carboxymethylaminomethyl modification enzyme
VFPRHESYLGILADDLVTRGVDEPYRMFTSRSEFRLLLRIDNADRRLSPLGYKLGLLSAEDHRAFVEKYEQVEKLRRFLGTHRWDPQEAPEAPAAGKVGLEKGATLEQLLKRPEVSLADFEPIVRKHGSWFTETVRHSAEIEVRYEGYIRQQLRDAEKVEQARGRRIPEDIDYSRIDGLSREIREKLTKVRPRDLAMASRIPGVTPAALTILNLRLELRKKR